MKLALITGTGMDSKTLTHLLLSKGYFVIMTYRRNAQQILEDVQNIFSDDLKQYPNSRLGFEFMDITDLSSVRGAIKRILEKYNQIDEVYSLAAMSHVGDSFINAEYTLKATGISVYYLLECVREFCPKAHFYQASTSEMFGGNPESDPFTEKSPLDLRSPYSIAKALGYHWVKYYRQTHNIFACSGFLFNHSNTYRGINFYVRKLTNTAAKIVLGKEKELICGNLDHWRDEHYADFGVEMMWKMVNNPLGPKDYVICNNKCNHGTDYLKEVFGYFNLNWEKYIKFDTKFTRPNEVVKLVGCSDLATRELGWKPQRMSFKDHIKIMCDWDYELESGRTPKRKNVFELYPL